MFLHWRGRRLPEAFVDVDLENAHRGHGWPSAVDAGKPTMAFSHGRTPRKYGRLFGQKASTNQLVVRPTYPPITGLLILEIQDGIYNFLLASCRVILHDIDGGSWFTSPSMPAPEAPMPDAKRGEWTSLPALALEAPYSGPCQLDVDRLQAMVSIKRSAAEDHLWLLREDPGYFLDALRDAMEHGLTFNHKSEHAEHAWKHVAGKMISDAFCSFYCWQELQQSLVLFGTIEEQVQQANHKTGRLPAYPESIWAYIDVIVDKLIWIPLDALTRGVPTSPRIRTLSLIDMRKDGKSHWEMKPGRTDSEYRIYVLFWALFSHEQRELHGLNKLVQEIQHTMDTDPDACDLLDPWVIERFSDVALMAEIQRSISSFQPWARGWRLHQVADKGFVSSAVDDALLRDEMYLAVLGEAPCSAEIKSLGIPTDGRFYYPFDKKRTKETTDEMRAAEKKLSAFWLDISKFFRKETGAGLFESFCLHSERTKGVQRTPAWVPPKVRASAAVPVTPTKPLPLQPVDTNVWRSAATENKRSEIVNSATTKVKTRGEAKPDMTPTPPGPIHDLPAETDEQVEKEQHPAIKLPKRVYRVFASLFPSASSLAHVGKEVAWDELLYAMNAVGMQPEKLYGSVWVFKPLRPPERCLVRAGRSIQFHEPKEVRRGGKIPPNMVRTFGRRLKHALGWEAEEFECE